MTRFKAVRRLALTAALSLAALHAAAAGTEEVVARYPKGSIDSGESADAALADVKRERAEVEARAGDDEYACYSKFFSSPCVNKVREQRRADLERLKPIEVEANAFKRRDVVAKRERVLDEQRARAEREAPERAERERINTEKAARKAADVAARQAAPENPPKGRRSATPRSESEPPRGDGRDRIAEHEARMEKARTGEEAKAAEREKNIAAYERKQEQAQERQRKVEERKVKRAQQDREKQGTAKAP
jgi:colicin import membrane protein